MLLLRQSKVGTPETWFMVAPLAHGRSTCCGRSKLFTKIMVTHPNTTLYLHSFGMLWSIKRHVWRLACGSPDCKTMQSSSVIYTVYSAYGASLFSSHILRIFFVSERIHTCNGEKCMQHLARCSIAQIDLLISAPILVGYHGCSPTLIILLNWLLAIGDVS